MSTTAPYINLHNVRRAILYCRQIARTDLLSCPPDIDREEYDMTLELIAELTNRAAQDLDHSLSNTQDARLLRARFIALNALANVATAELNYPIEVGQRYVLEEQSYADAIIDCVELLLSDLPIDGDRLEKLLED